MRQYPLSEVCVLFHIDPATLRRWLRRYGITPWRSGADGRCRALSQEQLVCLAQLRRRILIGDQFVDGCPACAVLAEQVARLAQWVAELEAALSAGESSCATRDEHRSDLLRGGKSTFDTNSL